MFRSILHTVASRVISSVLSFLLIILATNYLGAEGKGEISLFLLNLTILILFSSCVGGPVLVYSVPRIGIRRVIMPSLVWGFVLVSLAAIGLKLLGLQEDFFWSLLLLGLLESVGVLVINVLVGRKFIERANLAQLAQAFILLVTFGALIWLGKSDIESYIWALYAGVGIKILIGIPRLWSELKEENQEVKEEYNWIQDLIFILRLGAVVQLGNLAQLLNYRLAFYYLEYRTGIMGTAYVGIFSTALHIVEAFWLVSRSIATVQYAEISNMEDDVRANETTQKLHRFNLLFILLCIIPIPFIPSSFYAWIFGEGEGFEQIRLVLLWLIPGMIAIPLSTSLSHHFSGLGKPQYNLYSSGLGLIITAAVGFYWIPKMELIGAAQVSSLAYFIVYLVLLAIYIPRPGVLAVNLIPKASDFKEFKKLFNSIR